MRNKKKKIETQCDSLTHLINVHSCLNKIGLVSHAHVDFVFCWKLE